MTLSGRHSDNVPNAHANKATIPSLDDLTGAKLEFEGRITVHRGIELRSVHQGSLGKQSAKLAGKSLQRNGKLQMHPPTETGGEEKVA